MAIQNPDAFTAASRPIAGCSPAGLHVSDRIRLSLTLPPEWKAAATAFRDYLAENTLASELDVEGNHLEGALFQQQAKLGDEAVQLSIAKVQ